MKKFVLGLLCLIWAGDIACSLPSPNISGVVGGATGGQHVGALLYAGGRAFANM